MTAAISLGAGLTNPRVDRLDLDGLNPHLSLGAALHLHSGHEAYWTPSTFNGPRSKATWTGTNVLAVDVDHEGAHKGHVWPWCDRLRARRALCRAPGSWAHATPRGLRIVALLDAAITDPEMFARASLVYCARVRSWIESEGIVGLIVDEKASCDRARLLWSPRATVDGVPRRARVVEGAHAVVTVADLLAAHEPTGVMPMQPTTTGDVIAAGSRNSRLTQVAGALRRVGLSYEAIASALAGVNASSCSPPLDVREVARIAASVARYEPANADDREPHITLLDAGALAAPLLPVRYVLRHFRFAPGRPSALVGYAGTGKTYLACDLGLAVAGGQGDAWGSLDADTTGPVVHLDYELGTELRARYQRLARPRGLDLAQLGGALRFASFPEVSLTSPNAYDAFARAVDGSVLCVLDSLRAATPGSTDENASSVRTCIDLLTRVSEATGCAFVLIHHEGKVPATGDGARPRLQRARGSSAIADALGAAVAVTSTDGVLAIEHTKCSRGKLGEPVRLRIDCANPEDDDSDVRIVAVEDVSTTTNATIDRCMAAITTLLGQRGELGAREIRASVRGRQSARNDALAILAERGEVVRDETTKRYRLAASVPCPIVSPRVPGTRKTRVPVSPPLKGGHASRPRDTRRACPRSEGSTVDRSEQDAALGIADGVEELGGAALSEDP